MKDPIVIGGKAAQKIRITREMQAMVIGGQGMRMQHIITQIMDPVANAMHWQRIDYGRMSNAEKAGISWLYAIWHSGPVPAGWMDPFTGFSFLAKEAQAAVVIAMASKYGFGLAPPKELVESAVKAPVQ